MNTVYLLTGGNLGDSIQNLSKAKNFIEQFCGEIKNFSSIYKTKAWGITEQPDFCNQVLELHTALSPDFLMQTLLDIEKMMGRIRNVKLGPRIIDIDILLCNDFIINSDLLTIPHPHLTERKFALVPLNEVAAKVIHPINHKSIAELLKECPDTLDVHKISG